jgi:hypothetical protein
MAITINIYYIGKVGAQLIMIWFTTAMFIAFMVEVNLQLNGFTEKLFARCNHSATETAG